MTTPHIIDVTPHKVHRHKPQHKGVWVLCGVLLLAGLSTLALWPSLMRALALPLVPPAASVPLWSVDAPRVAYKPGPPRKILLIDDSYRQIRSDVENFTQSVVGIRRGIRQQIALSDVLIALKNNNPNITPEEAQSLLRTAGYDIPTSEVVDALRPNESRFIKDDNAARTHFAQEIAQEIITDKISGLLKNIELITRVGQYVLIDSTE